MRQMVPNINGLSEQQILRMQQQMYGMGMNGDLRKNAMNNRGQYQPYVLPTGFFHRFAEFLADIG